MQLKSSSINQKSSIPVEHVLKGRNFSPALWWTDLPPHTKSLALICEDVDAIDPEASGENKHFCHWVFYNVSPEMNSLPAGASMEDEFISNYGMSQGRNSFGRFAYMGPNPPIGSGEHHYHFTLYALDLKVLGIPGLSKKAVLELMEGHVLGTATLIGVYERPAVETKKAA